MLGGRCTWMLCINSGSLIVDRSTRISWPGVSINPRPRLSRSIFDFSAVPWMPGARTFIN